MPTINMLFGDLESLVGKKLPRDCEQLTELLAFVKGEVESLDGEELSIEVKDGNRPDLWSVEGIARALRGTFGIEEGLKQYHTEAEPRVVIKVDPRLQKIRPYIAAAVVQDTRLSDVVIRELIHLQEKLDQTYGRKRSRTSVGLYNFDLISQPLHYTVAKPTEVGFIPLGTKKKISLKKILEVHPKGVEYGHLVKAFKRWPILLDSKGDVLSFPPIINSNDLGNITEETGNILIEVTGTDHATVVNTLMTVALSIADRGGEISPARILYPYVGAQEEVTPNFDTSEVKLELKRVSDLLGLDLSLEEVIKLLKKARYDAYSVDNESIIVTVPCYRFDIMHSVDVIEDVAIMYGYNNIESRWPQMVTFGEISHSELIFDIVREVMIGLGFQEILTFSMSTPENLFNKMNVKPGLAVEITNPMTERFTCLRSWLMPSLMEFLSHNTHVNYPQKIFEVAECAVRGKVGKTEVTGVEKLACLAAHSSASFSEIKALLDAFMMNFGLNCSLKVVNHKTFIGGRTGVIVVSRKEVGLIGEIHPKVLEMWGLENPTIGFEIDLNKLFDLPSNG